MKNLNSKHITTVSLKDIFWYFFKLGTFGFGGAIVLANKIHKDLGEKAKWFTETEYKNGLAFMQFAPGPLVTQLSMYIGFLQKGILGAAAAGIGFILVPCLLVLLVSIFYGHYGSVAWMQGLLYGIGAAVLGIITSSLSTLSRKMIHKKLLWFSFFLIFLVTIFTGKANPLFFLAIGLITIFIYSKNKFQLYGISFLPIVIIPSLINSNILSQLFIFFVSAGSLAFGGGLAILPYLQTGVVSQHHWLTNKQFLDAIAVAMITPGPVVIASVFIGYLVAGFSGAFVATLGMLLPVYLIVIILTPFFKKHADNPHVALFVEGVIASALGATAGAIIILGRESITDVFTGAFAILAFVSAKYLKIPAVVILLIAGLLGFLVKSKLLF